MIHRCLPLHALAAVLLAGCLGCTPSNPFSPVPVHGKITYEDGTPIDAAKVTVHFMPDGIEAVGDRHPQPGQAVLQKDGTFNEVSTFTKGDGLIPGRHKVVIEATNADYSPNTSAVAAAFTSPADTKLFVEVKEGEANQSIDLQVTRGP